jgi:hypothetical protein
MQQNGLKALAFSRFLAPTSTNKSQKTQNFAPFFHLATISQRLYGNSSFIYRIRIKKT